MTDETPIPLFKHGQVVYVCRVNKHMVRIVGPCKIESIGTCGGIFRYGMDRMDHGKHLESDLVETLDEVIDALMARKEAEDGP